MTSGVKKDNTRFLNKCYRKFPFLITSEHYRLFGLDRTSFSNSIQSVELDNLKKRKQLPPIGVIVSTPKYGKEYFRPPFGPEDCCGRNPISAGGPQNHTHEEIVPVPTKYVPPCSVYTETIGRKGGEILQAMKKYYNS